MFAFGCLWHHPARNRSPLKLCPARWNFDADIKARYCKFSSRQKAGSAITSFLFSVVFFVLAAELPRVITNAWQVNIQAASVFSQAELTAPPKQGRSFGGTVPDAEDNGVDVKVWVSSVLNARRVLEYGARPALQEKGPFTFRAYTEYTNVSVSGSSCSFYERQYLVHRTGDLDEPVTIANPAFRYLEHVVQTKSDVVTTSFEDGVVPLLFAGELKRLQTLIPALVTKVLFPELVEEVMLGIARSLHAGSTASVLDEWREGVDARSGPATHSLVLPPRQWQGRLDADPGPISRPVARLLWTFSNSWSFLNTAREQPGLPAAWQQYVPSAAEAGTSDATVASFAAYFIGLDGRYTNRTVARVHVDQITTWVSARAAAGARSDAESLTFQDDIAAVLSNHSLLPRPEWNLVPAAQLAHNAVSGLAFWIRNRRVGGSFQSLNQTAGALLLNNCPVGTVLTGAGASLADFEDVQASGELAAPPEMSCFTSREAAIAVSEAPASAIAAAGLGTAEVALDGGQDLESMRFHSKLTVQGLHTAMSLFTSGSSMTGFNIQGSRITATYMQNTRNLLESPSIAGNILGTATSREVGRQGAVYWIDQFIQAMVRTERAAPGSADWQQAKRDIVVAAQSYSQHLSSADVSLINGICSTTYLPPQFRTALPLTCYELLDVAAWAQFVSQHVVWFPQFVRRHPTTGLPDVSMLRTGPLIQLTAREALFGYDDYAFRRLRGMQYPGVGPDNYEDAGEFATGVGTFLERTRVSTGADSLDTLGQVVQFGTEPRGVAVWGQLTPATGAWSQARIKGVYERRGQEAFPPPPGGSIVVWDRKGLRPLRYNFAGVEQTPFLKLWKLQLENSMTWPYFTSDRVADAPYCLRSLARLPGPDGDPLSIQLLLGKPRFLDCEASERAYGYSRMPAPTNSSDGSQWVVEPVTGTVVGTTTRWATFLRWGPSKWYPFLRSTIGPLVRVERTTRMPDSAQEAIRQDVDAINHLADVAIPVSLNILGVAALLSSFVFIFVIVYPPKVPVGLVEKQRRRRERLAESRQEKAKKADDAKKRIKAQMLAEAEDRRLRQPGAVVMSSALGNVASTSSAGVRGAPSFHAMASLASAASSGDAKLREAVSHAANARPWQKPARSALQTATKEVWSMPTSVLSIRSPKVAASGSFAGSAKDGKSIVGMSLSQAMGASTMQPPKSVLVQTPEGKPRRKKLKNGNKAMVLSPKRKGNRSKSKVAPLNGEVMLDHPAPVVQSPTSPAHSVQQTAQRSHGSDDAKATLATEAAVNARAAANPSNNGVVIAAAACFGISDVDSSQNHWAESPAGARVQE